MLPKSIDVTSQNEAREAGRNIQRRNIIEAAMRVLRTEGAAAITTRRIAQELDCSTKVIYTLFGGKEGLADALYREGFTQLQGYIRHVVPSEDAIAYLTQIANAYRAFALENPYEYAVMFGDAIPNFKPNAESLELSTAVFSEIVQVTIRLYGGMDATSEYRIKAFWALVHGMMSLEFAGHFTHTDAALFDYGVRAMLIGLFHPSNQ